MKLGFVSAILKNYDFYGMIDVACELGFQCVEVACWPKGKAERRYAGVSHIDVDKLDDLTVDRILSYCRERKITISSLAFYPNIMDGSLDNRKKNIEHLKNVISASAKLGVNMVTTFIGRDQLKTVEDNLKLFVEIWPPIIRLAERNGVKIAVENCPMLFDMNQWPGGQNLFTTPELWEKMFDLIPSQNFGINYDPSHFVWQMMDYIAPLYEFRDKIFHVHYKDVKLYPDKLSRVGTMSYPLDYMAPKLPGLGDVDWGKYVSALNDIGYCGCACIEVEDKAFEKDCEDVLDSLRLSKRYMSQFVI